MRNRSSAWIVLVVAFALAACGENKPADAGNGGTRHTAGGGDAHVHEGTKHDLGKIQADGNELAVTMIGDVKPNAEVVVEVSCDKALDVAAVRMWIGDEKATGALKCKAALNKDGKGAHAHVETGETIPEGAQLWISVENKTGGTATVPVALP